MSFYGYVKDKINYILGFIIYLMIIILYLNAMQIDEDVLLVICSISFIFFISCFLGTYFIKNRYYKNIEKIMDGLDEKYLISEVIKRPKREERLVQYNILKRANKSMLENVNDVRDSKMEYKEYIESWVHEIKIPITSAKLLCENNKSDITNKIDEEIEEINNYVEQVLFYARLDNVQNDFMISKITLNDCIRNVIARNKKIMIQSNMRVEVKNIDEKVEAYSDEKWLEFILNQIVVNSIKYKRDDNALISISMLQDKDNVKLLIKDNGIGIKKSEIDRVFDKGFTGSNGRNQKKSTGIGLYLCKRLSKEIGIDIKAESKENEYTEMTLIIPRDKKIKNED